MEYHYTQESYISTRLDCMSLAKDKNMQDLEDKEKVHEYIGLQSQDYWLPPQLPVESTEKEL